MRPGAVLNQPHVEPGGDFGPVRDPAAADRLLDGDRHTTIRRPRSRVHRRCLYRPLGCRKAPVLPTTSSSRTTPPAGLAMMTAFEGFEIPDQTVDSVCDLCASTTLLRTECGLR